MDINNRKLIKLESLKNNNKNILSQSVVRPSLITSYIPPVPYYIKFSEVDILDEDVVTFNIIILDDIKLKIIEMGRDFIDFLKEPPLLDEVSNYRFIETNVLPVGLEDTIYRFKLDLQDFYIENVNMNDNIIQVSAKMYVGINYELCFNTTFTGEDKLTELSAVVTYEEVYKSTKNYLKD